MEPTTLQKAIAVAQKASQEDQADNYEEAVRSYKQAVKYFLHILNREPQGKVGNQKIRDKCKEYLDRAEELQEYLDYKERHKNTFRSRRHIDLPPYTLSSFEGAKS